MDRNQELYKSKFQYRATIFNIGSVVALAYIIFDNYNTVSDAGESGLYYNLFVIAFMFLAPPLVIDMLMQVFMKSYKMILIIQSVLVLSIFILSVLL